MSGNSKDTTALILAAMDDLGVADARTIAEKADVGYSTAVRKLRDWSNNSEITKIDRGADPAHYALLPADEPLPAHLQPVHLPTPTGALFDDVDDEPAADEPHHEDTDQADEPTDDGQPADTDDELTADVEKVPEDAHTEATDGSTADGGDLEADDATTVVPDDDAPAAPVEDDGEQNQSELFADPAIEASEQTEADASKGHGEDAPDQEPPAEVTASGEDTEDAPTAPDPDADAPQPTQDTTATAGKAPRRPKAYFHTEAMAILRTNPDRAYTVGDVAKLILAKEIDGGAPASTKVSSGAISNALFKAAAAGECLVVQEKNPATFQAA